MDDYIKREDAHDKVRWLTRYVNKEIRDQHGVNEMVDYDEVQSGLDKIPAADVRENKRGKWRRANKGYLPMVFACSVCGGKHKDAADEFSFCPFCGAVMDDDWE